jgi:hypothetical protein
MMEAKKLQVKFFLEEQRVNLEQIVPVFHAWIRERKLGSEMLVDVADYAHVKDGPGVVLIGDASDFYLDLGDGRPGLLYSRKRHAAEDPVERVQDALRRALNACLLLENETALSPRFRFRTDEVLLRVSDRLRAENSDAGFSRARPVLEQAFTKLYGKAPSLERQGGERELLTVKVSAPGAPDAKTLLERLGGAPE